MSLGQWIAAGGASAAMILLLAWRLWRTPFLRLHFTSWVGSFLTAAALVVPATFVKRWLEEWAELDLMASSSGQLLLLLYTFLVMAPLEMALVALAVAPFWRLRRVRMRAGLSRRREIMEGVSFAACASLGYVCVRNLIYLNRFGGEWLGVARTVVGAVLMPLLCGLWGYALGRNARRGMGSRRFSAAWITASVFFAVCDQMIYRRSAAALLGVLPLMALLIVASWLVWREVVAPEGTSTAGRFSVFVSSATPSLGALRQAFRDHERPITLRWISFGALVTTGMITAGVVLAVIIGREMGLDFSAVDRPQTDSEAMAALTLLGGCVLGAFPSAGYLLARASGTRSVLEPAMATALAMVLVMLFMGMLAPLSVVFAIAFAPIAFALSCAGAWVGLGR